MPVVVTEVPGMPGYGVSRDGKVWTDLYFTGRGSDRRMLRGERWRQLPAGADDRGYRSIRVAASLTGLGKTKRYYVHHLILWMFVGPRPAGQECRHLNGDKSDCRLSNLRWGTRQENMEDRVCHGVSNQGERHGMTSLTNRQVTEILRRSGEPVSTLAAEYDVSVGVIYGIRSRRRWKCVS